MQTFNLTIKQLVDTYSEYLTSEKLSKKEFNKKLNQYKIDIIDRYSESDHLIITSELMVKIAEKFKLLKENVLVNEEDLNDFIKHVEKYREGTLSYQKF